MAIAEVLRATTSITIRASIGAKERLSLTRP